MYAMAPHGMSTQAPKAIAERDPQVVQVRRDNEANRDPRDLQDLRDPLHRHGEACSDLVNIGII